MFELFQSFFQWTCLFKTSPLDVFVGFRLGMESEAVFFKATSSSSSQQCRRMTALFTQPPLGEDGVSLCVVPPDALGTPALQNVVQVSQGPRGCREGTVGLECSFNFCNCFMTLLSGTSILVNGL